MQLSPGPQPNIWNGLQCGHSKIWSTPPPSIMQSGIVHVPPQEGHYLLILLHVTQASLIYCCVPHIVFSWSERKRQHCYTRLFFGLLRQLWPSLLLSHPQTVGSSSYVKKLLVFHFGTAITAFTPAAVTIDGEQLLYKGSYYTCSRWLKRGLAVTPLHPPSWSESKLGNSVNILPNTTTVYKCLWIGSLTIHK